MGHVGGQESLHGDKGSDTEWNDGVGSTLFVPVIWDVCYIPSVMVPLDYVVLDELHLLLRIMDISQCIAWD